MTWKRVVVSGRWPVLALAAVGLAGCEEPSAPPAPETGTMEFEWVAEGETTAESWEASGACDTPGFSTGSTTCAVGLDDGDRWLSFGVLRHQDDTFDSLILVHPAAEGSCSASFTPDVEPTCTLEFIPGRDNFSTEPLSVYVMTSGTITVQMDEAEGRLTGTFEGIAEDISELNLPPLTISAGSFNVDFTDG